MPDKKVSELPDAGSLQNNDQFMLERLGLSYSTTLAQIADDVRAQENIEFGAQNNLLSSLGGTSLVGAKVASTLQIKGLSVGSGLGLSDQSTNLLITLDTFRILNATQTGTAYQIVLADENTYIRFTNAAAIGVTIPNEATLTFPTGAMVHLVQAGTGQITVVPGSGVTLNHAGLAGNPKTRARYSTLSVKKLTGNNWDVFGDLVQT